MFNLLNCCLTITNTGICYVQLHLLSVAVVSCVKFFWSFVCIFIIYYQSKRLFGIFRMKFGFWSFVESVCGRALLDPIFSFIVAWSIRLWYAKCNVIGRPTGSTSLEHSFHNTQHTKPQQQNSCSIRSVHALSQRRRYKQNTSKTLAWRSFSFGVHITGNAALLCADETNTER